MTWADLITATFRRINVIQAGELPTADDQADAFLRLQDLVESWQLERLMFAYILRTTWTLTSTKGTLASPYTVGAGGDISIARPTFISDIAYQDTTQSPTLESPLAVLTDDAWKALPQKNLTAPQPVAAYYNPTFTGALGSLYLWMVPTQAGLQGVLYTPAGLTKPALVTDTIVLPPGGLRFVRDNLAVELGPEWRDGLPLDPLILKSADESKANLKRRNMRPSDMATNSGFEPSAGTYSILSDS